MIHPIANAAFVVVLVVAAAALGATVVGSLDRILYALNRRDVP